MRASLSTLACLLMSDSSKRYFFKSFVKLQVVLLYLVIYLYIVTIYVMHVCIYEYTYICNFKKENEAMKLKRKVHGGV